MNDLNYGDIILNTLLPHITMNKIVIYLLLIICTFLYSCNKKQSAVIDLELLSEELNENSSEYSRQDWEKAFVQYQQIAEEIDQNEYTDEELKEIGKLKARCMKQMSKGALKQFQREIYSVSKQLEGAFEEFDIEGIDIESMMDPLME